MLAPILCVVAAAAHAEDPFLRRTATVQAVEKVGPSVVNVTTEQTRQGGPFRPMGDPFFDRFFQDFFESRAPQTTQSLGSGVVIDAAGHVLTNEHVVSRADSHPRDAGRRPRARRQPDRRRAELRPRGARAEGRQGLPFTRRAPRAT